MRGQSASILKLATAQHGVVGHGPLRGAGFSPDQIERQDWLLPLHRGVYAVGHLPRTWRGVWLAAVLACGGDAVLSHRAAAALWELGPVPQRPVDVTVFTSAGRRARPGILIHRSRPLGPEETTVRHAIPATTPAQTLVDVANELHPRRRLERAVDEAFRLGLCDRRRLETTLAVNAHRPGAGVLAGILADHRVGSTLTRSELEERFLRLCIDHDLPRPEVNVGLLDYVVDFLWPTANLVVEVDGRASHGTPAAFQADRTRDARLTAAGYRSLRFTYADVTARAPQTASRVRNVLRLSAPTAARAAT